MRFLDIGVGDTRDELDIWVTIDEEYMGLFTTKCSKKCCNVPNRYNEFDSSTSKIADSTSTRDAVQAYSLQGFPNSVYRMNVAGKIIQDEISVQYGNYTVPNNDLIPDDEDEFNEPTG